MTGSEVSTAVRLGLNPIILVLNNDGYGTMRRISEGSFNVITRWNYEKICSLVGGGKSTTVSTKGELDDALREARGVDEVRVINVRLPRNDISPQLDRIGREVARIRGLHPRRKH
jgi:indolepyruvate decarboxylase